VARSSQLAQGAHANSLAMTHWKLHMVRSCRMARDTHARSLVMLAGPGHVTAVPSGIGYPCQMTRIPLKLRPTSSLTWNSPP